MNRPSIEQQVTFLHTDDLEKTAVFYQTILGLNLVLDQGPCRIYAVGRDAFLGFCRSAGTRLGGDEQADPVILTLVSQEVDAWHTFLVEKDVPIEKPPTLNEKFNIYHCFIRDPNGYLVEIQRFLDPSWPTP
ncbi:MAG: VOC family protein [Chloroflexi bacterium]|nr:MAG: VOC family protein [Chloroflexota bacterium]